MSRPWKTSVPLAAVLGVRVPVEVADRWRVAAQQRELSMSDWLRQSIDSDAVRVVGRPRGAISGRRRLSKSDPALLLAISRIGSNLNQIAHVLNVNALAGQRIDTARCLQVLLTVQSSVQRLALVPPSASGPEEEES